MINRIANKYRRAEWLIRAKRLFAPIWDKISARGESFRSYSQFGEDAVLRSLFIRLRHEANFLPKRRTYLDVGASSPLRHSNSYFLCRDGWRGILVEPTPRSRLSFRINRANDVLVEACAGTGVGEVPFYTWPSHDIFNTADRAVALSVEKRLNIPAQVVRVPSLSVDQIVASSLEARGGIGVLFIDVEGHELEVLRSTTLSFLNPYVIVIEILRDCLADILRSHVAHHIVSNGYVLYAWANPSLLFLRRDLFDRLHHSYD
jgi:FkbM family methyltransferase